MEIKGDGIVIRPLESVTQFYKEGKAMHHCVYANRYYRRSECLIMTAIVGEKHVETIEVNLKSFQIVQSKSRMQRNIGVSRLHYPAGGEEHESDQKLTA